MECPLVSVLVVTFNSAQTIVETLESIKEQSYPNLELVVSDDCSSDKTLDICREWLSENDSRFIRAKLLTVKENTGVTANCNRAFSNSTGEYIKDLAGDDVLLPDSITVFIQQLSDHPEYNWIVSKFKIYNDYVDNEHYDEIRTLECFSRERVAKFEGSVHDVLVNMAYNHFCPSPFFRRRIMEEIGGYDEKYKVCEDFPLTMELLEAGYKPLFVDEFTMGYRRNTTSVTSTTGEKLFNYRYSCCEYQIQKDHCFMHISASERRKRKAIHYIQFIFYYMGIRRNTSINRFLYRGAMSIVRHL